MSTLPDLGAIFDEHVASEFVAKDVDATMRTMTAEPYVWHVPALPGAAGAEAVRAFLHPISRTVSPERVIDEFIFRFTHDSDVPWMLPGIAPTGRSVRIPMVVVMGFEGDKVAYERIYWDQASVLVQIGVLDAADAPGSAADQADRLLELAAKA